MTGNFIVTTEFASKENIDAMGMGVDGMNAQTTVMNTIVVCNTKRIKKVI